MLDEICVDAMSTREACEEFLRRVKAICYSNPVTLEIYGDPAGKARHTSQVAGSDWDQVREFFVGKQQFDVSMKVKAGAPAVKDRTNAVNTLLENGLGEVQLYVDPKCKLLIRDLENVRWKRDVSGNVLGVLDKSQKDLTHVSDALGYFVETRWGRHQESGETAGIMF